MTPAAMTPGAASLVEACREYQRGLSGPEWLESLGLPDYWWCGPGNGSSALQLARWRCRGRWATPPMVFLRTSTGEYLACGLVVLAAAALEAWGRPVPEELQALAALALAEGAVRWEEGCDA